MTVPNCPDIEKLAHRPELDKALLLANRAGDHLVVTKLDRPARPLEHLIAFVQISAEAPGPTWTVRIRPPVQ